MEKRLLPEDFKEFLSLLNKNKVKYLLLGGWAVGIYAEPRVTVDMDVFISVDDENLDNLLKALNEFSAISVPKEHFKEPGRIFRMGRSPIRIEIINQASGINFNRCFKRSNKVNVDGIEITVISPDDLLINKQASGREKDIADLRSLEKILRKDK